MSESSDGLTALIEVLMEQARTLEYGVQRTSLLEEAVRMADAHGDVELAYRVRNELIAASSFGGQPDLTMVHFSWCLAQHDRDPTKFDAHKLLWRYKWVVGKLPFFPQIRLDQIEEMLGDMERRYREHGSTLHAVHHKRRRVAMDVGDVEGARAAHARMQKTKRDSLSDCEACVADALVGYYLFRNQNLQAVTKGMELIDGNLSCSEVPDCTYSQLLLPLLKLNRVEEAMAYHLRAYPLHARNPGRLISVVFHIEFLALTQNFAEMVKLVQKHLPTALAVVDQHDRSEFFRVCSLGFECLNDSGKESIKLKLPVDFALTKPEGNYETAALAEGFRRLAAEIGALFDARNGNDLYHRKLAEFEKLKKCSIAFPIRRGGE